MVNPKISIIVPCFNREKYIEKCIDSLSNQTFSKIEIIVVDDGSTDSSAELVRQLQNKDHRIKLLAQKRKGVAAARNRGLKAATAPYIMWCDSDDYFDSTMCERMYDTITSQEVDVVVCGMKLIYTDNSNQKDIEDYVRLKYVGRQKLDFETVVLTDVSLPTKIFKKSLVDKYKMHFPDGLHFEDAFFCDQYFSVAKTIYYLDEKLYNYVRHDKSIMSKSFKKDPIALDYIQIIPRTYNFLQKNKILKRNVDFFWHRFIQYYAFTIDNAPSHKRKYVQNWAKTFIAQHESDLEKTSSYIHTDLLNLVNRRKTWKSVLYRNRLVLFIWQKILRPIIRRQGESS